MTIELGMIIMAVFLLVGALYLARPGGPLSVSGYEAVSTAYDAAQLNSDDIRVGYYRFPRKRTAIRSAELDRILSRFTAPLPQSVRAVTSFHQNLDGQTIHEMENLLITANREGNYKARIMRLSGECLEINRNCTRIPSLWKVHRSEAQHG